jgi:hypothetical protein
MVSRTPAAEIELVLSMLARERLCVDEAGGRRTCFISHLGVERGLAPGAWICHRDLVAALSRANLSPSQKTSLARAVVVEHGDEFGVGRLLVRALPSGLPAGGSSVLLQPRDRSTSCLYTTWLGPACVAAHCRWLRLVAQPEWASETHLRELTVTGIETLLALGAELLILVKSTLEAVQVAALCSGRIAVFAHPRFAPFVESSERSARVILWPTDALASRLLRRRSICAVAVMAVDQQVRQQVEMWCRQQGPRLELVEIRCPHRASRQHIEDLWRACAAPRVLLSGDPRWVESGRRWLAELGAIVQHQSAGTQLPLLS